MIELSIFTSIQSCIRFRESEGKKSKLRNFYLMVEGVKEKLHGTSNSEWKSLIWILKKLRFNQKFTITFSSKQKIIYIHASTLVTSPRPEMVIFRVLVVENLFFDSRSFRKNKFGCQIRFSASLYEVIIIKMNIIEIWLKLCIDVI